MASPLANFSNARLLWPQPAAAPANFRQGPAAVATTPIAIELFLSGSDQARPTVNPAIEGRQTVVNPQERNVRGWVVRYATVPTGQDWLSAGSGWSWTATARLPAGFDVSDTQDLRCYWGPLPPNTSIGRLCVLNIRQVGGDHGTGGIGAIIQAAAGDSLIGSLSYAA